MAVSGVMCFGMTRCRRWLQSPRAVDLGRSGVDGRDSACAAGATVQLQKRRELSCVGGVLFHVS